MGRQKEKWIENQDLGIRDGNINKFVCPDCFEDYAIKRIIETNSNSCTCDYCQRESDEYIAAPLNIVNHHIALSLNKEYCDPADVLPYDNGYIGKQIDLYDLFQNVGLEISNINLQNDIISSFCRDVWAERNWLGLSLSQSLHISWNNFEEVVKNERRFTFWAVNNRTHGAAIGYDSDCIPVGEMLKYVAKAVSEYGLIHELPIDTPLWRVRLHSPSESIKNESDLASPPDNKATQSNRMSPAGISMFYGAEDFETAVSETINPKLITPIRCTGGYFIEH